MNINPFKFQIHASFLDGVTEVSKKASLSLIVEGERMLCGTCVLRGARVAALASIAGAVVLFLCIVPISHSSNDSQVPLTNSDLNFLSLSLDIHLI